MEIVPSSIPFEVRTLRREDLIQAVDIFKETKWQMGTQSIYTWYEFDPSGFKVAVTDSGEILGICAAVRHSENFHFVGFYIMRNKYRGMGIGYQVWKACMEYVGHRNAGLNSVPEMNNKYQKKGGFAFIHQDCLLNEYETHDEVFPENLSTCNPEGVSILPFDESLLPSIFEYDYKMSGYNRQLAVELNCKEKDTKTVVAFKGDICIGFASIKSSITGDGHVGPMYADDADTAEAMLRELLLSFPLEKGFSMVTLAANHAANDLMRKIGCPKVGILPRMYKYEETAIDFKSSMHKMFAQFDIYFAPF